MVKIDIKMDFVSLLIICAVSKDSIIDLRYLFEI